MPRYIDADKLKDHYSWWADEDKEIFDNIIDQQPTVNAVEVVRCKDCRKREKINGITVCPIAWIKAEVSDDDFCSLGEREEE